MEMIEEAEGEMTEDIKFMLKQLDSEKDELLESMLQQIKNEQADIVSLSNRIKELEERKTSAEKREERIKTSIIPILKLFNMKNPAKKATNYIFKSAEFQCYTVVKSDYVLDDFAIQETFKPIEGKVSKFINYSVSTKLNAESLKVINETKLIPITDINVVIDRAKAKAYLKEIETSIQLELQPIPEGEDAPIKIVKDPIVAFASLKSKESLTIR
jgi:hypothetical protein